MVSTIIGCIFCDYSFIIIAMFIFMISLVDMNNEVFVFPKCMCILLVFTERFLLARILYIDPLQFQSQFFDRRAELTPRTLLSTAQVWGFVKR